MGDDGPHMAGVPGDQREPGDRAAAAAEDLRGPAADRLQHPPYVVGQQVGLGILVAIVDGAAAEASGIVGHDGVVVGEQRCDRGETGAVHGVADEHQHRARALHLVVQARARDIQHMTRGR